MIKEVIVTLVASTIIAAWLRLFYILFAITIVGHGMGHH